jgi:DNA-binding NarL/FixJ family response regulator
MPSFQVKDSNPGSERRSSLRAIRLLLVDDHAMVRTGLRELLNLEPDLEVIGEAPNGEVGVRLAGELKPDVVIMDLSMPVLGGTEATKQILARDPAARVLALSAHEDAGYARAVLSCGAAGYVLKRSASDELVRALRSVAAGETYLDPVLADELMPRSHRSGSGAFAIAALSERERGVMRLVAQGYTAKEMADKLGISPRTLETYKARAMAKLNLSSRADLIRYAARSGWLREP